MKRPLYEVMASFRGSPDGRFCVKYAKGETVELTDSLAEVAIAEGWVKHVDGEHKADQPTPHGRKPVSRKKAVVRKKTASKRI